MEQIIWSTIAEISLTDIWSFYAKKDIAVADKIIDEIIQMAESIEFGEQFQIEEYLEGDYRRAIVRHFKIIYRVENNHLRIIDVFDTRQDPEKMKKY